VKSRTRWPPCCRFAQTRTWIWTKRTHASTQATTIIRAHHRQLRTTLSPSTVKRGTERLHPRFKPDSRQRTGGTQHLRPRIIAGKDHGEQAAWHRPIKPHLCRGRSGLAPQSSPIRRCPRDTRGQTCPIRFAWLLTRSRRSPRFATAHRMIIGKQKRTVENTACGGGTESVAILMRARP